MLPKSDARWLGLEFLTGKLENCALPLRKIIRQRWKIYFTMHCGRTRPMHNRSTKATTPQGESDSNDAEGDDDQQSREGGACRAM